jgi:hypothetical protein
MWQLTQPGYDSLPWLFQLRWFSVVCVSHLSKSVAGLSCRLGRRGGGRPAPQRWRPRAQRWRPPASPRCTPRCGRCSTPLRPPGARHTHTHQRLMTCTAASVPPSHAGASWCSVGVDKCAVYNMLLTISDWCAAAGRHYLLRKSVLQAALWQATRTPASTHRRAVPRCASGRPVHVTSIGTSEDGRPCERSA